MVLFNDDAHFLQYLHNEITNIRQWLHINYTITIWISKGTWYVSQVQVQVFDSTVIISMSPVEISQVLPGLWQHCDKVILRKSPAVLSQIQPGVWKQCDFQHRQ